MNIIKRSVLFAGIFLGLVFSSGCSGTTPEVDNKTMPLQKIQLGQFQTKEQLVEYLEKDRRFVELKSISLTYKPDKKYIAGQYEQLENFISKYNLSNAGKTFNKEFPKAYALFKQSRGKEDVKGQMHSLQQMVNNMIWELRFAIYRDVLQFNRKGIMSRQEFSTRATKAGFRYIREKQDRSDGRIYLIYANYDESSDVKIDRINLTKVSEPTTLNAEIFDGKVIRIAMNVASRNFDNRKEILAMTDARAANAAIASQIQLVMQPQFRYSWVNLLLNSLFENDPQIAKDVVAVLNEQSQYSIEFIQDSYQKRLNESLIDGFKKTGPTWVGYFPPYEITSGLRLIVSAMFSLHDMRPIAAISVADPNYDLVHKYYMWAGKFNDEYVQDIPIKLNGLSLNTQSTINSEKTTSNAIISEIPGINILQPVPDGEYEGGRRGSGYAVTIKNDSMSIFTLSQYRGFSRDLVFRTNNPEKDGDLNKYPVMNSTTTEQVGYIWMRMNSDGTFTLSIDVKADTSGKPTDSHKAQNIIMKKLY